MWPTALQMTRDECRGLLRRLELESYSNVVSAFRAQGGLSEAKVKILDDLRTVFHISHDRHRAEARRAANDEQLSTIAESISGPNTYQDWTREGRRGYPLLPRVAPQTAVSAVANTVASEVTKENLLLPYPAETISESIPPPDIKDDLSQVPQKTIVSHNPFVPLSKVTEPNQQIVDKKKIKRSHVEMPPTTPIAVSPIKKRNLDESESSIDSTSPIHIHPIEPPKSQIQQLYQSHSKTQARHKKVTNKKSSSASAKRVNVSPNKTHKHNMKINDNSSETIVSKVPISKSQYGEHYKKASTPLYPNTPIPSTSTTILQYDNVSINQTDSIQPDKSQQIIATSKKDISKNLSKLNMPKMPAQGKIQTINMAEYESKTEKLSTPVQKYIVEERNPTAAADTAKQIKLKTFVSAASLNNAKFTNFKTIKGNDPTAPITINTTSPQIFNVVDSSSIMPNLPQSVMNLKSDKSEVIKIMGSKILPAILSTNKADVTDQLHSQANMIKSPFALKPRMSPVMTTVQLKNLSNRNNLKFISSTNGKILFQTDGGKSVGKISPIITPKGGLALATTNSGTQNRIAIQKIQIIQPPTINSANKTKPNMIYMQTNPSTGAGTIVKKMPFMKSNKILPTNQDKLINTPTAKASNVIVIGSVPTTSSALSSESKLNIYDNNMITEDTPVDILTTPIIVDDELPVRVNQATTNEIQIIDNNSKNPSKQAIRTCSGNLDNIVIGATDWEMELDQEVNKTRALNAQKVNINNSSSNNNNAGYECKYAEDNEYSAMSDDNYNDVIEEDHIEVVDDETLDRSGDVIQYDENYESVNEELDDNIAIEYIEEDQLPEIYEQKIDSSTDQSRSKHSNIVYIKGQIDDVEEATDQDNEQMQNSQLERMVSVEEISSTSQMESVQNDV